MSANPGWLERGRGLDPRFCLFPRLYKVAGWPGRNAQYHPADRRERLCLRTQTTVFKETEVITIGSPHALPPPVSSVCSQNENCISRYRRGGESETEPRPLDAETADQAGKWYIMSGCEWAIWFNIFLCGRIARTRCDHTTRWSRVYGGNIAAIMTWR